MLPDKRRNRPVYDLETADLDDITAALRKRFQCVLLAVLDEDGDPAGSHAGNRIAAIGLAQWVDGALRSPMKFKYDEDLVEKTQKGR